MGVLSRSLSACYLLEVLVNLWFTLFSTVGVFSFVIGLPWLAIGSWSHDAREIFGASMALALGGVCCLLSFLTL